MRRKNLTRRPRKNITRKRVHKRKRKGGSHLGAAAEVVTDEYIRDVIDRELLGGAAAPYARYYRIFKGITKRGLHEIIAAANKYNSLESSDLSEEHELLELFKSYKIEPEHAELLMNRKLEYLIGHAIRAFSTDPPSDFKMPWTILKAFQFYVVETEGRETTVDEKEKGLFKFKQFICRQIDNVVKMSITTQQQFEDTTVNLRVFRGMSKSIDTLRREYETEQGKFLEMSSLTPQSSSLDETIAETFAGIDGVVLDITLPPGPYSCLGLREEFEVTIMPPLTIIQIGDPYINSNGYTCIPCVVQYTGIDFSIYQTLKERVMREDLRYYMQQFIKTYPEHRFFKKLPSEGNSGAANKESQESNGSNSQYSRMSQYFPGDSQQLDEIVAESIKNYNDEVVREKEKMENSARELEKILERLESDYQEILPNVFKIQSEIEQSNSPDGLDEMLEIYAGLETRVSASEYIVQSASDSFSDIKRKTECVKWNEEITRHFSEANALERILNEKLDLIKAKITEIRGLFRHPDMRRLKATAGEPGWGPGSASMPPPPPTAMDPGWTPGYGSAQSEAQPDQPAAQPDQPAKKKRRSKKNSK